MPKIWYDDAWEDYVVVIIGINKNASVRGVR